jgi:hypothetical protein
MRNALVIAATVLVAASVNTGPGSTGLFTGAEAASICVNHTVGKYRKAKSQDQAKKEARMSWRTQVAKQTWVLGYRDWHSAQNRAYDCNKSGSKWSCRAKATPCVPL